MKFPRIIKFILWLLIVAASVLPGWGASYPAGVATSGLVDVTALPTALVSEGLSNLDKTGATDNRARLQALVDRFKQETATNPANDVRILYFPDGTYLLSGGITGVSNTPGRGGILFQGQSRDGTILRLANNSAGFGNASSPAKLFSFFEGEWTNNAFFNGIESLTIDTGTGNAGAVAVAFVSNNTGYIRDLRIRTGSTGTAPGHTGLLLNTLVGSANPSGVGIVRDVIVTGFARGIDFGSNAQYGFTLENITLSGQTETGIRVNNQPVSLRKITSTNSVPAITLLGASSQLVVIDSQFNGGSSTRAAIERTDGYLFARAITQSGYRATILDGAVDVTTNLADAEYFSTGSQTLRLWSSTPAQTLDLPVAETPAIPWDSSAGSWAFVDISAQDDDTAAFQAALNSGASTVCIVPGTSGSMKISATCTIGPNVRRILGQWCGIQPAGYLFHADPGEPLIRFSASNHPAVVIEKFRSEFLAERKSYLVHHQSASDLVLRDIFYVSGPLHRNTGGVQGRLFIEDVHCLPGGQNVDFENQPPGIIVTGQTAYMRQVNPEQFSAGIVNDGGTVWIFGFKVGEAMGPAVRSINNATTEILGGVMNMSHPEAPSTGVAAQTSILEINNSNVSAILCERYESTLGWGQPNTFAVKETRGSETRTLLNTTAAGVPRRPGQLGAVFPLYVGYQLGATITPAASSLEEDGGAVAAFAIARGSSDTSAPLTISYTVSGSATSDSDFTPLTGTITIPAGQSEATLPITPLNDEGAEPSETLTVTLQPSGLYSLGPVTSASVTIHDDDLVEIADAELVILPGSSGNATLTLHNPTSEAITVTLTPPSFDNYAYTTSDQPGGPTFNWTDISGNGTKVLHATDDGFTNGVNVGFPFPYYGTTYTQLYIHSNGFLMFTTDDGAQGTNWINNAFSAATSNGYPLMIAPMWEDLNPAAINSDAVYYKLVDADTFIVQWNSLLPYGNNQTVNLVTFQAILKRDGTILFQYLQMNSDAAVYSYTTGVKNADESKYLMISHRNGTDVFNPDFAHPLMAVRLDPLANWFTASTTSVTIPAGGSSPVTLNYSAAGRAASSTPASSTLVVTYPGSTGLGAVTIPISMLVSNTLPPSASNVAISGIASTGATLTANYTYADPEGNPQGTTQIEWLRAPSASGPWSVVGTGSTRTVQASEAGTYFKIRVTPVSTTAPTTGSPVTSPAFGPISGAPAAPSASALSISGSLTLGSTLTANYTYSDPNGDPESGTLIEWLRSASASSEGSAIASGATYTITAGDVGNYLRIRVTPSSSVAPTIGTPVVSNSSGPVLAGSPPSADSPTLAGSAIAGYTLTATYTFSDPNGDPEGATTIEWLRSTSEAGTYVSVGTGLTRTLSGADAGQWLKARITPVSTAAPTNGTPADSAPVQVAAYPGGLLAHWSFDDGLDPTWDTSGNARHADIQTGSNLVSDGHTGGALEVTANGGAHAGTAHIVTGDFTLLAWIYRPDAYASSTNEIILAKGWDFYLAIDTSTSDGKLRVQFKHGTGTTTNAHINNAKTLLAPGQWHHVAVAREGAAFRFYINGVARSADYSSGLTTAAPLANAQQLAIGYNTAGSGTFWRGLLDEVMLYGRALTAEEISLQRQRVPDVLGAWNRGQFATLPGGTANPDAAPTADPDADGLPNLLEFALGGDPLQSGSGILPVIGTSTDHLTLSFTPDQTTGLSYFIEASSDLSDWSDASDITDSLTPGQPCLHTDSAGLDAGTPRRFLRLRVVAH